MSDTVNNEDKYLVFWESKITGVKGNGSAALSRAVAEDVAKDANKMYPEIHHWIEKV